MRVVRPATSPSRPAGSKSTDLRSGCSALATAPDSSRLGEKACSVARRSPAAVARNWVFSAMSCSWLPTRRHSTSRSRPIWLAYRPRSPNAFETFQVKRKG